MKRSQLRLAVGLIAIAGVAYVGWHYMPFFGEKSSNGLDSSGGKNKPVTVSVVLANKQDYPVKLSANGVVTALNVVDVRTQLSSTIAKVHIKEGQFVKAGETLFTLDNRAELINLQKAQAQLAKELATLAENQRQLTRSKELFEKKFQSQSTVDSSQTLVSAQLSVVDAAKAAVEAAKVNLSYSKIVAPASGRTGLINVYPGSLVQPNATGSALVTITQMSPIAITFSLPQRSLSDALASMKRADSEAFARIPETEKVLKGKLQFVDNVVDAASGTVKVKAVFDNKEMLLWPGAYANIDLSVLTLKDVVVIPQETLVIGTSSTSVYVIDAENNAEMRKVNVNYSYGRDAIVTGLDGGVKVIVEGKQNLRPGAAVKVRKNEDDQSSKAASSSTSSSINAKAAVSAS